MVACAYINTSTHPLLCRPISIPLSLILYSLLTSFLTLSLGHFQLLLRPFFALPLDFRLLTRVRVLEFFQRAARPLYRELEPINRVLFQSSWAARRVQVSLPRGEVLHHNRSGDQHVQASRRARVLRDVRQVVAHRQLFVGQTGALVPEHERHALALAEGVLGLDDTCPTLRFFAFQHAHRLCVRADLDAHHVAAARADLDALEVRHSRLQRVEELEGDMVTGALVPKQRQVLQLFCADDAHLGDAEGHGRSYELAEVLPLAHVVQEQEGLGHVCRRGSSFDGGGGA